MDKTVGLSRRLCFAGQAVELRHRHPAAGKVIDFLFADIAADDPQPPRVTLDIRHDPGRGFQVHGSAGGTWGAGESLSRLAQILLTETLYQLVYDLEQGLAIHAAALVKEGAGILIPGPTGAGKSTLTAWLALKGWQYQTDELVVLHLPGGRLEAFTRPVCLKPSAVPVIQPLLTADALDQCLAGPEGLLIPHRLLNADFRPMSVVPRIILIPDYQRDVQPQLIPLSGARTGFKLMGCHVNARNLPGHGFAQVADLARDARTFRLTYGGFQGLAEVLDRLWQ